MLLPTLLRPHTKHARHRALGFVDLQAQFVVAASQQHHYPLSRLLTAHVDVAVIGVSGEAVPSAVQFPIHFIHQHIGQQRR